MRSMAPARAVRRLRLRCLQQCADFGQVLQSGELGGRAALGVAAVRQHLAGDLLRQEAQGAGQESGMVRQRDRRGDQALQRRQRPRVQFLGRQRRGQARASETRRAIRRWRNKSSRGGEEEVVMAEPRRDPRSGDIGPLRDGVVGTALRSSPTPALWRATAPRSVPSARRSRSQVKPFAAARRYGSTSPSCPASGRERA